MRALLPLLVLALVLARACPARADDPEAGREHFVRGAQHVKQAEWAEALAEFEASATTRPHPVTSYNIAACHRAMGHYVLARKVIARALEENAQRGGLSLPLAEEIRKDAADLASVIAHLDVTLTPDGASVSIDGRPLERADGEILAGTLPAGPPSAALAGKFDVLVDPGIHVVAVSRPGFADTVRTESLKPGGRASIALALDRLPATLRVTSTPSAAQVLVDDADVGLAPLVLSRPAGRYHVVVKRRGFITFDTHADAGPGQDLSVVAPLREDRPSIVQRWWFWTGVAVVAGAAVTTYLVTRPPPERPGLNGGGLGWTARSP